MSGHRSSLTLGHDSVDPSPFAQTHPTPSVGSYGGVHITEDFVVTSHDPEQLLAISTAFADAALALMRILDGTAKATLTCNGQAVASTLGEIGDAEHVCSCGTVFSAPTSELLRDVVDAHYGRVTS